MVEVGMTAIEAGYKYLYSQGWEFVPTGPHEWEWIRFDREGNPTARGGDSIWERDVERAVKRVGQDEQ